MTRLDTTFARLAAGTAPGLVTYVTAGDPDLSRSRDILLALDEGGADVIEVGVPFSDPLADGPVIQRASERALAAGATLASVLDLIASVRPAIRAPLVLFTYANPVYRMGLAAFAARAAAAGVDGVLTLDVPVEESGELGAALRPVGLDVVFLVSPTTTPERIRLAGERGSGFLYAISRLGVTGARATLADGVADLVGRVRAATDRPVAVGFGISTPEHVRDVCRTADAAVVGSALVQLIADHAHAPDLARRVAGYVGWLKGAAAPPAVAAGPGRR